MNPEISIIVPVYKVEKYLEKCIDSILSQTFKNFELILVNDGSPDNCGKICEYYKQKDSRVNVIHKENGGISDARNMGLNYATGNYIGFVDSDDYLLTNMYEVMYNTAIKNGSDIVVCDFFKLNEDENDVSKCEDRDSPIINLTNYEALEKIYTEIPETFVVVWNKLFKKEIFKEVKFDKSKIYEDEFITHKLLLEAKKVTYIRKKLYNYLIREGSIVNSPYNVSKLDKVFALNERVNLFRRLRNKKILHLSEIRYTDLLFWNYFVTEDNILNSNKELKILKKTFNRNLPGLLANPFFSIKQKVFFIIFFVKPKLFKLLIKLTNGLKNKPINTFK
ncbi:glycosyltransferase family 2 protein [Halobacillus sp. B23F22_1]|uniref:glycosyltransferase family 2 protein n=1 Tax=Halobacillus sp. B23F22_1 TaxID=3459514 RepID=UPI00373E2660